MEYIDFINQYIREYADLIGVTLGIISILLVIFKKGSKKKQEVKQNDSSDDSSSSEDLGSSNDSVLSDESGSLDASEDSVNSDDSGNLDDSGSSDNSDDSKIVFNLDQMNSLSPKLKSEMAKKIIKEGVSRNKINTFLEKIDEYVSSIEKSNDDLTYCKNVLQYLSTQRKVKIFLKTMYDDGYTFVKAYLERDM